MHQGVEPAAQPPKGPLAGQAVITGAAVALFVSAVIRILRAYGHEVTGDQEAAIVDFLRGPGGDIIELAGFLLGTRIAWANVYSRISVFLLTDEQDPSVPKG